MTEKINISAIVRQMEVGQQHTFNAFDYTAVYRAVSRTKLSKKDAKFKYYKNRIKGSFTLKRIM